MNVKLPLLRMVRVPATTSVYALSLMEIVMQPTTRSVKSSCDSPSLIQK